MDGKHFTKWQRFSYHHMTSKLEGAKAVRKEIRKFHACLMHKDLVPDQFFRRNSLGYPLVSYISQAVSLYESKNYDVIPAIVGRICVLLDQRDLMPVSNRYFEIVYDYLCLMVYFLDKFTEIDKELGFHILSNELLTDVGFRKAPLFDMEKWKFISEEG